MSDEICHMHGIDAPRDGLDELDVLVLPMHKRVVAQYATNEEGARELRLYYGDKEISFDEPDLFTFGETLARQSAFVAGIATGWGENLDWTRVCGLLEQLIEEGVLKYADAYVAEERTMGDAGNRPSPLPPAPAAAPRTWFEAESITGELAERPLETGYLELVVPIFRVAHMSLDAEGRQVGEANVFPPQLRIDVPTKWRSCIYEGTRHQSERPMNVTALKSMRAYWGQMMAMLLEIRAAYLERFPAARAGWTVGDLERLSVAVLTLPTYLLMRRENRVENGDLHPALSCLFRVTDGLRMTMHQMLFVPLGEAALTPDTPMTSEEIYAYAERNYSFHSGHGVCAGPRAMIEEFFAVLVDGKMPRNGLPEVLDHQVADALSDLQPVFEYAFLGLQAYAAVFSVWPAMARTYATLAQIASDWAPAGPESVATFRDVMQERMDRIVHFGYLATEERRAAREAVYADMYAQCGFGISGAYPQQSLTRQLADQPSVQSDSAAIELQTALARHLGLDSNDHPPALGHMVACLMDFLVRTQAALRVACATQRDINALLERDLPERPFTASDIDVHIRLRGEDQNRAPYLVDDLGSLLGISIELDKDFLEINQQHSALA